MNFLFGLLTLLIFAIFGTTAKSDPANILYYDYRIEQKVQFERRNFTQGLEIHSGRLYVSSGLYGQSALRVYDFPSMKLNKEVPIDNRIFAEGLTIIDDQLILLSWRERIMLFYELPDLKLIGKSQLPLEGWGATHDDSTLWFSDGSNHLYFADMSGDGQLQILPVTLNGKPLRNLNELEWVEGEIWANLWQTDQIARIDPDTGIVAGIIDLAGLLNPFDRHQETDVLNGIARDPATGHIWVTGKRWPWIYRIELKTKDF